MSTSSRHHYIPKFLINAFTNLSGNVFIYDKHENKIKSKPRPPKSIFFEYDRNTLETDELGKNSGIEDTLYSQVDSITSPIVKYFQNEKLQDIEFNPDNTSAFLFFLIHLFWRIPRTDFAFKDLIERSIITPSNENELELKSDSNYQKLERAKLYEHHIRELTGSTHSKGKWFNIIQSKEESYILGDNPLLFKSTPWKFTHFAEFDYQIAISSTRAYYCGKNKEVNKSEFNCLRYNAAIIEQSMRYVVSGDKELLEKSVMYYNQLKLTGENYTIGQKVFELQ